MNAHRLVVSIAVAAACSPAIADNPQRLGYVVDSRNNFVTSGSGQCVKTGQWTPELAVEPCDAVPRKAVALEVAPKPEPAPEAKPAPPPPPKIVVQSVDLSADTLFAFDRAALEPEGRSVLNNLAHELGTVRYDAVFVVGHADRIGSSDYNHKLSERRANAVKEYLANEANIPGDRISVDARGSNEPVTRREDCRGKAGNDAIACLAPDRRVTVEVTGTKEVTENAPK